MPNFGGPEPLRSVELESSLSSHIAQADVEHSVFAAQGAGGLAKLRARDADILRMWFLGHHLRDLLRVQRQRVAA